MSLTSDYSFLWLIPIVLLAVGLSYGYYYRSNQRAIFSNKEIKWLFVLRAFGLILSLLLLLGIVWEAIDYRKEKPLLVTVIDQSSSMKNYKDSATVDRQITALTQAIKDRFDDEFDLVFLSAGEKVTPFKANQFKDKTTDLSAGFDHIRNNYFNRNVGAVVLVSDGNFNQGVHPMYTAERLNLVPVFTLGVGDSAVKRDIVVKSVLTNEVAFLNNEFPIEAVIDFQKTPVGTYSVALSNNGQVVERKTVRNNSAFSDQQRVEFQAKATKKGFQRYTISVNSVDGEFTKANNQQSCYIEVIDTKSTIVLLGDGPHPDLAALRSVFESDKQAKIKTDLIQNYTLGNESPSLVVWYENGIKPNPALFGQLRQRNVPIWLIQGATCSNSVLQSYGIAIKSSGGNQQEDVYPSMAKSFTSFEFSTTVLDVMKYAPPLRSKFGSVQLPNGSEVLLTQRVGTVEKKDPLFAFVSTEKGKIALQLGEGIWRWKMKEYVNKRNFLGFEEFVQKASLYLTLQQNKDPFRVTFPKRFTVVEEAEVKAEFYNPSMELITTPEIVLSFKKTGGKAQTLNFTPQSNFYLANLGNLSAGTYEWTAVANDKGKKYTKSGKFVVEDIALEKLTTRSDFGVLEQLSNQSDGKFQLLKNYDRLLSDIEKRSDIAVVQHEDISFEQLIDWWLYFVLLIVVFSSEWFLRRFWGSY